MVSIHGPLGYGPSTLPLRHSAARLGRAKLLFNTAAMFLVNLVNFLLIKHSWIIFIGRLHFSIMEITSFGCKCSNLFLVFAVKTFKNSFKNHNEVNVRFVTDQTAHFKIFTFYVTWNFQCLIARDGLRVLSGNGTILRSVNVTLDEQRCVLCGTKNFASMAEDESPLIIHF